MTSYVERIYGRKYGRQPELTSGFRGHALVLQSVAGLTPDYMNTSRHIVGSWKHWACGIPLLIYGSGAEPYDLCPIRWMSRDKYPIGGTTIPVLIDPHDPQSVKLEWDEVPTIDEAMARGLPVFTDPGSVQAHLVEQVDAHHERVIQNVDRGTAGRAADAMGPDSIVDPGLLLEVMQRLREQHSEANPKLKLERQVIDGPSGRILAVGREDGNAAKSHGEVLLSVSVPGARRYGVRWKGWIPASKMKAEWWDVPIEVDPRRPDKVDILWDQVPGVEIVTPLLREANERMRDKLAAPMRTDVGAYDGLLSAIADPDQRAKVEQQLAQALGGGTAAAPAPAPRPDPLDQLKRLGELRDAGALTQTEFEAEKARLLSEL